MEERKQSTTGSKKKNRKKKKLKGLLLSQILLLTLILGALAYYFFGGYAQKIGEMKKEAQQFVNASTEQTFRSTQTSVVYDADGKELSVLKSEKDSYYISYNDIPEGVRAAIVSIEDKKFFKHKGVDFKAIVRAAMAMMRDQKITQGGSTITQQLARTVFLSNEKTWERKIEEIFIAANLEKRYTKEQILEFYLNNVYFSNGYYGIEAAARGYFSKGVAELDLAEQALLCGIPNNPTIYDPIEHPENAISRRDRILKQMYDDGKIMWETYEQATQKEIKLKRTKRQKNDYVETYIYYCATRVLMEQNGFVFRNDFSGEEDRKLYEADYEEMYAACQKMLFTGGYRIYTSIDMEIQQELQQCIDKGLEGFSEQTADGVYKLQSAGVCIDNETGCVTAIVGGRSQEFEGYTLNRAYQSHRQPGSAIKPLIVYTPLLERGYTPDSIVKDEAFEGGPTNAGNSYAGDMTLRRAVEKSKNTIAWKLMEELTPEVGLQYLKNMRFTGLDARDMVPAIALGGFTYGTSAVEMASGYATIENDGIYREPTCIKRIETADGQAVYKVPEDGTQVYDQNAARMMTDILSSVMTDGTGKGLDLGAMPSAGKTGTTNDHKDGWFCGFTRYFTTAIWVGYDIPTEMKELSGSTYPGYIWQDFMKKLHKDKETLDFMPFVNHTDSVHVESEEPEDKLPKPKPEKKPEKEKSPEKPEQSEEEETPEEKPQTPEDEPIDAPEKPEEKPKEEPKEEGGVIIIPSDDGDSESESEEEEVLDGDVVIVE